MKTIGVLERAQIFKAICCFELHKCTIKVTFADLVICSVYKRKTDTEESENVGKTEDPINKATHTSCQGKVIYYS